MGLIGVLSSSDAVQSKVQKAFSRDEASGWFRLSSLKSTDHFLSFLNYDLPEIVIIDFSDHSLDPEVLIESIRDDSWLHSFGIIGLYDRKSVKEDELLSRVKDINVLTVLDYSRIADHMVNTVKIIEANRQIIFQRELNATLVERWTGSFIIGNDPFAAGVYAGLAATSLAQRGVVSPDQKIQLQICLTELILNGIEHGNCKINFEEKSAFLFSGRSIVDLVNEKCSDPEIAKKKVFFEWDTTDDRTVFKIRDEGDGFDVASFTARLKKRDPEALNGRGIMMARSLAQKLYYNKKGNKVTLVFGHSDHTADHTPKGFSGEESVEVSPGDTVFKEGETSDYLYYISSGTYDVFVNGALVGRMSPSDVFMGEMSFLLNNRRSATVKAHTAGKLVRVSRKAFVSVVKEYPHYGIFLSRLLARKLVRANERPVH